MSTLFFYLLRIKILGSFKSPVNSTTLDLSGHQPLHQRHSGPSCIISGLDYGKRPQTDVSASAAAQPLPSNVYSPSSRQSDPFKRQFDYIPCLFKGLSLTQSGSPSPDKGLQALHNLTFDSNLSLTSFLRLLLYSQPSWLLGFPPTCAYTPAWKILQEPFPLWNTLPAEGVWMTLSFPSRLGLKCHLFPESLPWLPLAKIATVSCSLASFPAVPNTVWHRIHFVYYLRSPSRM